MAKMKTIGIIGGMGALATADLFYKIINETKASKDSENIPLIIDNNTQIPDRTEFILGNGENPLPELIKSAKRLKNSGCELIVLACNTAHFFADEIIKQVDIQILHIAKNTINVVNHKFKNVKKVAVIATTATKKTGIYDKELIKFGFESVYIDDIMQNDIMSCIYDGAKAGKITEYLPKFESILNRIKADIYIAACTEIPLFLPYLENKFNFIDPTLELAKEIIKYSRDIKII